MERQPANGKKSISGNRAVYSVNGTLELSDAPNPFPLILTGAPPNDIQQPAFEIRVGDWSLTLVLAI